MFSALTQQILNRWNWLMNMPPSPHLTPTTRAIVIFRQGTWTIHLPDLGLCGRSTQASNLNAKEVYVVAGSITDAIDMPFSPGFSLPATFDFTDTEASVSFLHSSGGPVACFSSIGGFWEPCQSLVETLEFQNVIVSDERSNVKQCQALQLPESTSSPLTQEETLQELSSLGIVDDTVGASFKFGSVVAYTWAVLATFNTTDGYRSDMRCWGPGIGGGEVFGVLKCGSGAWDALLSKPGRFYVTGGGKGVGGIAISFLVDGVAHAKFLGAGTVAGGLVGWNGTATWSKTALALVPPSHSPSLEDSVP
ncbi:hypothetical protein FRB98_006992 [Tulasnella sp. 332]|nr:hypothetical protein FRB98_006992 [Tulasnella sp. 332]